LAIQDTAGNFLSLHRRANYDNKQNSGLGELGSSHLNDTRMMDMREIMIEAKSGSWVARAGLLGLGLLLQFVLAGCGAGRAPLKTGYLPADAGTVVITARSQLGKPYRNRGASPQTGFDCSGFTRWVYLQHGVTLPRQSLDQYLTGEPVKKNELQSGDLVFFDIDKKGASHVGIYSGGGFFVHSSSPGGRVREDGLDEAFWQVHYLGARRVLP
jgi:murein DD-endopeptidase